MAALLAGGDDAFGAFSGSSPAPPRPPSGLSNGSGNGYGGRRPPCGLGSSMRGDSGAAVDSSYRGNGYAAVSAAAPQQCQQPPPQQLQGQGSAGEDPFAPRRQAGLVSATPANRLAATPTAQV